MWKNYLKIAFRNMLKTKFFSIINVTNLALGIACTFFILLWIISETSWDSHHQNFTDIYRIAIHLDFGEKKWDVAQSPVPLGPALKEKYPEIESYCRIDNNSDRPVSFEEKIIEVTPLTVDPAYFKIFTNTPIYGNPYEAIINDQIVLNHTNAIKIFGTTNCLGKVINLSKNKSKIVGAVIEDLPIESQVSAGFILKFGTLWESIEEDNWGEYDIKTYIKTYPKTYSELSSKIKYFMESQYEMKNYPKIFLQRIDRIHLHSNILGDKNPGNYNTIKIFAAAAIIILLIACFNFANITIARAQNRKDEIGLRKIVGATKQNLIVQFLMETFIFSLLSLIVAVTIIEIALPAFNNIAQSAYSIQDLTNATVLKWLGFVFMFTILASGLYPALHLAKMQPASMLKKGLNEKKRKKIISNLVIVLQFTVAAILVIASFITMSQFEFMQSKELGYTKQNLLEISLEGLETDNIEWLKHEMQI